MFSTQTPRVQPLAGEQAAGISRALPPPPSDRDHAEKGGSHVETHPSLHDHEPGLADGAAVAFGCRRAAAVLLVGHVAVHPNLLDINRGQCR